MKNGTIVKAFLGAVAALAAFAATAEVKTIDLAGEAHTLDIENELAEVSFVNSSETTADLVVDISSDATFKGLISGNIRLVKNGSATLSITGGGGVNEMTGVNEFTGGVALNAGTIEYTVAGSLGSGTVTIKPGALLKLAAANVECPNPIHLSRAATADANAKFISFAAKNTAVTGDVTADNNTQFCPETTSASYFRGKVTMPGTKATIYHKYAKGRITFAGPVTVYAVHHATEDNSTTAGFSFWSSENSWHHVNYNQKNNNARIAFLKGAIPAGSYITQSAYTRRAYTIHIDGDQSFAYFNRTAVSGNTGLDNVMTLHSASANNPATVTLGSEVEATATAQKAGTQQSSSYCFTGLLSLVYAPEKDDSAWKITANDSTMNGSFTVRKGIVEISGTATFASVTNVVVGEGAKFSCTSTGASPLAALKHVSLEKTSTLELGENIDVSVETFLVGGRPVKKGTYTGKGNGNAEEGVLSLDQLAGKGVVRVPYQPGSSGLSMIVR